MTAFDPGESASIISVTDQVRAVKIGAPVTSVHFLGPRAAFVGAEENVSLVSGEGEISRVTVHAGGILCAASRWPRGVVGRQNRFRAQRPSRRQIFRRALDSRRSGVCAEGPAAGGRAL